MAGLITQANQPSSKTNCAMPSPPPPLIPIEGKSYLVNLRLQHVQSLTPRATAIVSRID